MFNKYYQDELAYLRDLGREFAEAYPALAPMLADREVRLLSKPFSTSICFWVAD